MSQRVLYFTQECQWLACLHNDGALSLNRSQELQKQSPPPHPKKTTRSRSSYDWMRGGVRVECKSAQLSWNKGWLVHFKNIKQHQHDVLVLCLYLPTGIIVFECFANPPLYGQGGVQEAKGKCLLLRAGKMDSKDAIKSITEKLLKFSKQTASIVF